MCKVIFGEGYKITEASDIDNELEFTLEQNMTTFTDDCVITPEKTVFDVNYLNTVFGDNYPVDVTLLDYELFYFHNGAAVQAYQPLALNSWYLLLVENGELGTITLYEMDHENTNIGDLRIIISNDAWNVTVDVLKDTTGEVNLVAKSLEAYFEWTYETDPVVGQSFDLTYFNGVDWINVGTYITDAFGFITINELLIAGDYRFNGKEFTVLIDDTLISESFIISSDFGGRRNYLLKFQKVEVLRFIFFLFFFLSKCIYGVKLK